MYNMFSLKLLSIKRTSPSCISPNLSLNFTVSPVKYFIELALLYIICDILLLHKINQVLDPSFHRYIVSGIGQKAALNPTIPGHSAVFCLELLYM